MNPGDLARCEQSVRLWTTHEACLDMSLNPGGGRTSGSVTTDDLVCVISSRDGTFNLDKVQVVKVLTYRGQVGFTLAQFLRLV